MAKSTIITTNTTALSRAADAIQAQGEKSSKNRVLNIFAAAIAGPGKDWGFLKNAPGGSFVQPGLDAPAAAPETTQNSIFVVVMDEREDWARDPDAYTSLDALKQGLRDTYAGLLKETGLSLDEAINKAISENGLRFPQSEAEYEDCEQPCALNIHEFKISAPNDRQSVWALEMDEKSDWGWRTRLFNSKAAALAAAAKTIPREQLGETSFEDAMAELARTGEFDSTPQEDVADDEDEDDWFELHDDAFQVMVREIPIEGMEISPVETEPQSAQPSSTEAPKCATLYHPDLDGGEDQGLKFGGIFFEDRNRAEEWAKDHDLDQSDPDWHDGLIPLRDCQIEAEFLPQIWDGDEAREMPALGDKEWEVLPHEIEPKGYFSDYLKTSQNAPAWVRDWDDPFEIYLTVTVPDEKID